MNEQERKAVQALLDALKDHEQALAKLGLPLGDKVHKALFDVNRLMSSKEI